jgi:hypothetical protein
MKLYDYFRSSAAYRVRIAINMKGLKPAREFVHLRKNVQRGDDYLALNPQGLVPALVADGGEVLTRWHVNGVPTSCTCCRRTSAAPVARTQRGTFRDRATSTRSNARAPVPEETWQTEGKRAWHPLTDASPRR